MQTIFQSLEEQLAKASRRVVSDWRCIVLLHNALSARSSSVRRWNKVPLNLGEARALLQRLATAGDLIAFPNLNQIYRVASPYASQQPIEEDELLMELQPYAAISHLSALRFHNLTPILPKEIHLTVPSGRAARPRPVGTRVEDWRFSALMPKGQSPQELNGRTLHWHATNNFIGTEEYSPRGYPVRVTSLEKTLIDGLAAPEICGGLNTALESWVIAKDLLSLRDVLQLTDELNVGVLRQRVGFVLEKLGFSGPRLETWTKSAKRGGSSKLLANAPFAPVYSERWQLSLNASISALESES